MWYNFIHAKHENRRLLGSEQPEIQKPEILAMPETAEVKTAPDTITTPEKRLAPPAEKTKKTGFKIVTFKKPPAIPTYKDEETLKIEKIMENDLKDIFLTLSPIAQQEFKIKGEETAIKIRELLRSTHVKVKKIFELIVEWLKFLPGINKFFLEQEAKIKTDKILQLKK